MTEAALRLQEAQAEDMAHLSDLAAVKEQTLLFTEIKTTFCARLQDHLLGIFQEHVRNTGGVVMCFRSNKEYWGCGEVLKGQVRSTGGLGRCFRSM